MPKILKITIGLFILSSPESKLPYQNYLDFLPFFWVSYRFRFYSESSSRGHGYEQVWSHPGRRNRRTTGARGNARLQQKQYLSETTGLSHVWAHSSCDCTLKTCTGSHQPELQPRWGEELIESHPLAKEQLAIDGCPRGRVFFRDTAPERQCMLHHIQAAFVGLTGFLQKCTWSCVQKVPRGFKKEL